MNSSNNSSVHFQKIAEILSRILNTVDSNNVVWTKFDRPDELVTDLMSDIEKLQSYDREILVRLRLKFAPTGMYQELAISNGWGDEYLKLAELFDHHYEKIVSA
ncbi:MAG: hypothetical protein M3O71_20050 [Bacteroidota bacterium]|nr:hypothetical protein [Bacteroidota bacterium]